MTGLILNIIIVGGIGGLTAALALREQGHHVRVLGSSSWLRETGAAINIPPNATCAFAKIGFDIRAAKVVPFNIALMYVCTPDKEVKYGPSGSGRELNWSAPARKFGDFYFAHRVDLHDALQANCINEEGVGPPVQVQLSSRVVGWNAVYATVELQDGTKLSADLLVAADGVHLTAHVHILGQEYPAISNGATNIRFVLPTQVILDDPETRKVMDDGDGSMVFYSAAGMRSTLLRFPCHNNKLQNFGACYIGDPSGAGLSGEKTTKQELIKRLEGLSPELRALAHKAEDVLTNWKIADREPFPAYHKGRLVLLGDAAHPMLTYQGQGAAQSIEDGAVLGLLLSGLRDKSELAGRLELYSKLRTRRAGIVQLLSKIIPSETDVRKAMSEQLVDLFAPEAVPASFEEICHYFWRFDCVDDAHDALEQHLHQH